MGIRPKNNFSYLLAGLVVFVVIGPIAATLFGRADSVILMVMYTLMLIIGIWSLQQDSRLFHVGNFLAVICVALTLIDFFSDDLNLSYFLLAVLLMFQGISIWIASRYVFNGGDITGNRLMGGISIYLLVGLTYNILYTYTNYFDPTAFAGIASETIAQQNVYWEMTYFSFVTLTTLGYGDIEPVSAFAKMLAYTEAVFGTLYVAILIGVLVGSFNSQRREARNNN